MAIPLRYIATGEGHVRHERKMMPEFEVTAAAFLFEWALTKQIGEYELSVITEAGLLDDDPTHISEQICDSLEKSTDLDAEYRGSCFWALGKRCDPLLREFFQNHLAIEVRRDMGVAFQIMLALANLGESVWPADQRGFSLLDVDINRVAAFEYLSRLNRGV